MSFFAPEHARGVPCRPSMVDLAVRALDALKTIGEFCRTVSKFYEENKDVVKLIKSLAEIGVDIGDAK
jgi:hypothetical protein